MKKTKTNIRPVENSRMRGSTSSSNVSFYIPRKGQTVIYPTSSHRWSDPHTTIKHITKNMAPSEKPFTASSKIYTLGSCFANNLAKALAAKGVQTQSATTPSNLQNVFSIEQFFRWAIKKETPGNYWHEPDGSHFNTANEQDTFFEDIQGCDGFIITLGLSEIWKNVAKNEILWRGVPKELYTTNQEDFGFEVATTEQTTESIHEIVRLIRSVKPEATIVFTLSPVPLGATFRGISSVVADTASKAILRAALCSFILNSDDKKVHYWPSFEIVKESAVHGAVRTSFGTEDGHHRHVSTKLVDKIIAAFCEQYFTFENND